MGISKRHTTLVVGMLAGVSLSVIMSLVMTLLQLGISADFWWEWGRAFVVAFVISTPLSMILLPPLTTLAEKICDS